MGTSRRTFLALAGAGTVGLSTGIAEAAAVAGRTLPLLSTYVAGSDRYAAPALLGQLERGATLTLKREPGNGYDPRAVSIWTVDGQQKLGYVPRIHNQALANLMDAGMTPHAEIGRIGGPAGRPDIAVSVSVVMPG